MMVVLIKLGTQGFFIGSLGGVHSEGAASPVGRDRTVLDDCVIEPQPLKLSPATMLHLH